MNDEPERRCARMNRFLLRHTKKANTSVYALLQAFMPEGARRYWTLAFTILPLLGLVCACIATLGDAYAQVPTAPLPPASPAVEARLKKLETELRCLVCQNQTLAESPANLAGDLRREIRALADRGKSNDEIKQFLQVRYGDFVLYSPPIGARTYLLWFGPFVLLLFGMGLLVWISRRRPVIVAISPASVAAQARAKNLLSQDEK